MLDWKKYKLYFWGAFIFIVCLIPGHEFPPVPTIPHLDKIIHAYLYGQWFWFFTEQFSVNKKSWSKIILFLLSFGICMELIQHFFVPHRSMEIADVLANACGVFIVLGYRLIKQ